eukprot:CAMPEP_0117851848 /NCGR_PEP_ID=MMETSP0949-20121206/22668_1 /TAXON_ID=44440 /ORGANISM="Chattonella subsalsa, Strain CCMP2191" /LENGTH=53 /DNA_ID=CAMNT_0005699793 /DNA_START=1 /DNA_END=159 /DNA_ORIENTATION=+
MPQLACMSTIALATALVLVGQAPGAMRSLIISAEIMGMFMATLISALIALEPA